MAEIQFEPDLSHCIQTLARAEYERVMRDLLATEVEQPEAQGRLETLRAFLESTDFGQLRSTYEPLLVQGRKVRFTLRSGANATEYEMGVE